MSLQNSRDDKDDILNAVFDNLKMTLINNKDNLEKFPSCQGEIDATENVSCALRSVIQILKDTCHNDLAVLVQSVTSLVGYNGDTFKPLLSSPDVHFLQEQLSEVHLQYFALREKSPLRAQAYTLLTALTLSSERCEVSLADKLRRFESQLETDMFPELSSAAEGFFHNRNWEEFEQVLKNITKGDIKEDGKSKSDENVITEKNIPITGAETPEVSQHQTESTMSCEKASPDLKTKLSNTSEKLFDRLGLLNLYPQKLKLSDLLLVNSLSVMSNEPSAETKLWRQFIYRLMMFDTNVRYLYDKTVQEEIPMTNENDSLDCYDNDDDFYNFGAVGEETVIDYNEHIHPMDIFMAVFHCSDDTARQRIFTKLSTCQFAVPLLVPDLCTGEIEIPFPAFQQIKKTLKTKHESDGKSSERYMSQFIISARIPTVSFIRLGRSSNSKSQIMNNIISKKRHPVFFSRQCSGNTTNRLLLDGVAEIFWYCPGGGKDDIFETCVAFVNLHGNAQMYPNQLAFIQEISTVIVLLLSENKLEPEEKEVVKHLRQSCVPLITLFSSVEHNSSTRDPTKIAAKDRNEAELTEEIISKVSQYLKKDSKMQRLEDQIDRAREIGFIMSRECEKGNSSRERAENLMSILKGKENKAQSTTELLNLKKKHLPLQGELWTRWCQKDKEFYRLQSKRQISIEEQLPKISREKQTIREKQQEKALSPSNFIICFLQYSMQEMEGKKSLSFLTWLEKSLDLHFTDVLSDLHDRYHKTWTEMRQNTINEDKTKGLKSQDTLKEISENIKNTKFNVQHILREISQLYEALQPLGEEKMIDGINSINRFPEIGAEMLLSGYPLELMDGDVHHIPLDWISAVLDKLICELGDKKMFVLSVLGLQSSGKSTLLNTMFGVQFAVSAGRCTTGALMQLVPVEEKLREQLHFDFVLVVDTEGLRSVETNQSSTLSHDNELATFVVGLGDVTLINIMGENPSEIQDILQICFQAFLRMTSVEVKPRCFFVHQNVAETTAVDKNQEGRRQLIAKLDEISRIVAEAEDREVSGFSDIIQFDVETQVFYIKNFFEGDPPMAPPNLSYSQNVQELKTNLLNVAKREANCKLPTLSEFRKRLKRLWTALMKENFVFHFRNSLHVMVYSKLEDQYGEWSWTLRKHALETQNSLHYKICSGEIGDTQMKHMREEIKDSIGDICQKVKEDSDKYFTESKHPEILIQWRDNVEKRLESLKYELIDEALTKMTDLLKSKICRLELDKKRVEYMSDLLQKSKALATELKKKQQSDEELGKEFNKMWTTWAMEVSSKEPKAETVNMQGIIERILQEKFKNYWDRIIQQNFQFNVKDHVKTDLKDTIGAWTGWNYSKQLETGNQTTQKIHEAVNKILIEREREGFDVNDTFIHRLLKEIDSVINCCETECQIKFKALYKAQVSFDACSKAVESLKRLNENFKKLNDPLTYFGSLKDDYFKMFKNFCNGAASVKIFADFLCDHIKSTLPAAVFDKVSIGIVEDMKSNHPAFSGNRSNLEKHILKYLAEKENFDMFMDYIWKPKESFKDFITEHVEIYLSNRKKLEQLFISKWLLLAEIILRECKSISTKIAENQGNASMWLEEFCRRLWKHIPISRENLKNIEKEDISDTEFLKNSIAESFREITDAERVKHFFNQTIKPNRPVLLKFRNRPDDILTQQMSGCWEQCPFCKAVCTNTIPNHDCDHSVQTHRCQALGGLFHEENILISFSHLRKTPKQFCLQFCTEMKVNDKFKPQNSNKWISFGNYREAGPPYNRWNITPDGSEQHYWKWFICTFQSELQKHYQMKFEWFGEIPERWKNITKQVVLRELNQG